MTYLSSLTATDIACDHQARACRIDLNTSASCDFGLKRSTLSDASCNPKASDTSARKRARSFFGIDRILACTMASNRISSADGRGSDGTGSDSDTRSNSKAGDERDLNGHGYRPNICESRQSVAVHRPTPDPDALSGLRVARAAVPQPGGAGRLHGVAL